MQGDFTRDTFDRTRDFYRVLLQQGRVQVDADWNEQIAILLHRFETLVVDIFGPHGGPENSCGFAVFRHDGALRMSRGRYYVDGWLCENREIVKLEPPVYPEGEEQPRAYVVYLDVYERFVAAAQDPSLADAALGGLDTAGRSRITWRVMFWPLEAEGPSEGAPAREHWEREGRRVLSEVVRLGEPRGRLRARASSQFGYTGSQNQFYRIEIHQGGMSGTDGKATWKWSRENASVAFAVTGSSSENGSETIHVRAGPRAPGALSAGDWIEIATAADSDDDVLKAPLHRVAGVAPGGASLTLDSSAGAFDGSEHAIVRRWDQYSGADGDDLAPTGGCLPLIENTWLPLESGIEVYFSAAEDARSRHYYRAGDYWLIPARTATASIDWPADGQDAGGLPPHGVRHRYAPLAGLVVRDGAHHPVHDLRVRRDPLAPS
jgi:hypothetical protein